MSEADWETRRARSERSGMPIRFHESTIAHQDLRNRLDSAGFGRRGDMVWNALVIVTVLLPLSGLAIDVPRYFALRSRLQAAVDAAAEAAARQVDIAHYQNTGETRLDADRYGGRGALGLRDRSDEPARAGLHGQLRQPERG